MPLNVDKISTGSLVVNGTEINNGTAHYELDFDQTSFLTVNTTKGIIDILGMGTGALYTPAPAFSSTTAFYINNPDLDLTVGNRENIYMQYSVYYSRTTSDNTIPYVISTGVLANGIEFSLYNANPATAGVNNWDGALYVYYELYTLN
jgi:hypothetical protein